MEKLVVTDNMTFSDAIYALAVRLQELGEIVSALDQKLSEHIAEHIVVGDEE
jgi:hypothetical protein